MKKLRIAVLAPIHWRTPPRGFGPWELVASNHTEELVKRGHDVTLYATADSITKGRLRSVAPRPLLEESRPRLDPILFRQLHQTLPFEDADEFEVIHNHADGYALTMSRLVSVPVVSTMHAFTSQHIHELYLRYDNVNYVSVSMAQRRHCPAIHWVANVHHGMDFTGWQPSEDAQDWLGFIGRIDPAKGVHIAIDVAKRAAMPLKIAGPVDERDASIRRYWVDHIEPQIDGRRVSYLGEISGQRKIDFYRDTRAILAPLQWEEPFGLVFLEAMAAGTPVIAFARGSAPEIVRNGVSGWVVPADDIDAMVHASRQAAELSRAEVRAYVEERFSVGRMVDGYEAVYAQALGL